jgi:hypothetical protein
MQERQRVSSRRLQRAHGWDEMLAVDCEQQQQLGAGSCHMLQEWMDVRRAWRVWPWCLVSMRSSSSSVQAAEVACRRARCRVCRQRPVHRAAMQERRRVSSQRLLLACFLWLCGFSTSRAPCAHCVPGTAYG